VVENREYDLVAYIIDEQEINDRNDAQHKPKNRTSPIDPARQKEIADRERYRNYYHWRLAGGMPQDSCGRVACHQLSGGKPAAALTIKPVLKNSQPFSSHFPAAFQPQRRPVNLCRS
jgi:hypothetical protein